MTASDGSSDLAWFAAIDRALLSTPRWLVVLSIIATLAVMVLKSLPNIPREYVDLSATWVGDVQRYDTYGPDSLSDMYGTRVIANDPWDMYTKARTEQTPAEAATWSREAAAPYPPVVLLAETGLYLAGERLGIGFYGMILGVAILFIAASLLFFLQTRWYLFPLLYLNFDYLSYRFVYVQDNTYLVMLITVLLALWLARSGRTSCHFVMALATTMKLSPLCYVANLPVMGRRSRVLYVAILTGGLVVPYFVWDNYLYIYRYGNDLKGDWLSTVGALLVAAPFAAIVWYVQERRGFDLGERVGWSLVPFALFLALKMNVARHLLLVLLVPDKRGLRNVAAAAGLLVPALAPGAVAFNSSLAIAAAVLAAGLAWHLRQIGWRRVREDVRHPGRTVKTLLESRRTLGP